MSSFAINLPRKSVISVGTLGAIPKFEVVQPGKVPNKATNGAFSKQNTIVQDPMIHQHQYRFNKMVGTQNYIGKRTLDSPPEWRWGQKMRSNGRGTSYNLSSSPLFFPQNTKIMEIAGAQSISRNPLGMPTMG